MYNSWELQAELFTQLTKRGAKVSKGKVGKEVEKRNDKEHAGRKGASRRLLVKERVQCKSLSGHGNVSADGMRLGWVLFN
jgi:hypothetical protein